MKGLYAILLATLLLTGLAGQADSTPAVEIFYTLSNPGGGTTWEYDYTVANHTFVDNWGGVSYFNTYFPATQYNGHYVYSNVTIAGTLPYSWWSAGTFGPESPYASYTGGLGVYGVSTGAPSPDFPYTPIRIPIVPGQSLGGFDVTFTYLGDGTPPGPQQFQVMSLETANPLFPETGFATTQLASVPLPPSVYMLGASLVALALVRKKR